MIRFLHPPIMSCRLRRKAVYSINFGHFPPWGNTVLCIFFWFGDLNSFSFAEAKYRDTCLLGVSKLNSFGPGPGWEVERSPGCVNWSRSEKSAIRNLVTWLADSLSPSPVMQLTTYLYPYTFTCFQDLESRWLLIANSICFPSALCPFSEFHIGACWTWRMFSKEELIKRIQTKEKRKEE